MPQRRCGSGCDLFLLITATLLAIALIELSFRAFEGVAVWQWTDFRKQRAAHLGVNAIARYDPDLGWTEKANWTSSGNGPRTSTMRDGIRASGADALPAKPEGPALAVGNSFTFGSDVADDETWPAFLARKLKGVVINAGVEGFGFDQAVLRAKSLMPSYRPGLLIADVFEEDLLRATYSRFEKPKPYFMASGQELERRNGPVPIDAMERESQPWWAHLVGRSYALDKLLMKLDPFGWGGLGYEETGEDPSRLGCLLLRRLASKAKVYGAKLVLVIQYAGETIASGGDRPAHITALISCAHLLDIVVVDEFEDLRALVHEKGSQALREQ